MKIKFEWDCIDLAIKTKVSYWRAKVIGGWLYKEQYYKDSDVPISGSVTFIPDPFHQWEWEIN